MNLRLLQISDSALPVGGYTHSWGLEVAIARGQVHDATTLEAWTRAWLLYALGPLEGVVVAAACRAVPGKDWGALRRANELLTAALAPPSVRAAGREMGEQLLALAGTWAWSAAGIAEFLAGEPAALAAGSGVHPAANAAGSPGEGWQHAVIFGLLGGLAGGDATEVLTAYLHQAALGMIGAGVRAVPVGHTHGQQVLAYLHDDIAALAAELARRDLETAGGGGPFYEVLCDEQTRLYTRLFRS